MNAYIIMYFIYEYGVYVCACGFCICDANIFKALLDIHSKENSFQ